MVRGMAGMLQAASRLCAGMAAALPTLLVAVAVTMMAGAASAADAPVRIQVVFDGSGSMWGKIPGDSGAKYAIAREALRQALPGLDLARPTEIGLVLFGHRRRGDCSDVEQALAPLAAEAQRLIAPLEALNPKGRGPLALALVAAADALPGTGGRESLVLIHDDLDNCQGDPCATAAELNRVRPRLPIHVVSIGMKPEDVERMSCVSRITGGRHFDAQDAAAVGTAVGEALRLASLDAPDAIRVPRPREVTRQSETGPPGLRLSAVLADGGEPLEEPVEWRVFRADDASAKAVAEAVGPAPRLPLAPGSYVVEARRDLVVARQPVDVLAGRPTRATVVLNAGAVRLSAPFAGAGAAPTAVISLEEQRDGNAGDRVLWLGPAQDKRLVVPAGTYRLVLQDRQFRAERTIVVPTGSSGAPPLAAGAGRVRLEARDHAQAEQPAGRVLFRVLEDDPTAADGRREVARSAAPAPQFTLPAGTYHLVASKGAAEVRELIALRAGDDVNRTLVLKLARLSLSSRLPGAAPPAVERATYRIYRQGGEQIIARAAQPAPPLQLPAGRYRVEARLGQSNAAATSEVELKEGADHALVVEPAAALVELRLARPGPGPAGDVFWEVRDGSSAVVWRTTAAEPREFLAAGRYTIRAETRERRAEKVVELRAGEKRTIEVAFE